MRAFDIDAPLPAAGLVLLLDEHRDRCSRSGPGTSGSCRRRSPYRSASTASHTATGFAYGLVLQVVEMSVGVGVGLVFLAREGLSFASLQTMEQAEESRENVLLEQADDVRARDKRERERVAS